MAINNEKEAVRRLQSIIKRVKEEMKLAVPPSYNGINDPVAKHLGIIVKEEENLYGDGGMYILSTPPKIAVDSKSGSKERLNFTFFHEVTHHLLRQDDELYAFLDEHSADNDSYFHSSIEHFCDIGASEFLVPRAKVHDAINKHGFSIDLIERLDNQFPASKPAIAIQLAQCAPHKCIIIICEYDFIPRKKPAQEQLVQAPRPQRRCMFVRYSSSSPTCKYVTGRFVQIPEHHLITDVHRQKNSRKGRDQVPVRSGKVWLENCEAFFYKGKVYASFNLTDPPSKNQLPLF